ILCSGAALFGFGVAWGVGGGRHLAELEARGGFALVVALLAGGCCFLVIGVCRRLLPNTGGRLVVVGAFGVSAVLAELANHLLLVRLYSVFHLGLSLLSGILV